MESAVQLLVAEKDYLIAIETREILLRLFTGEVAIAPFNELESYLSRAKWDVVLVDTSNDSDSDRRHAELIVLAGAAIVFLTGHSDLKDGIPGLEKWPVAIMPFTDGVIVDAVMKALGTAYMR